MRQGVAALEDSRALDDPLGIEAETLMQMFVGDDGIGHRASGGEDADTGKTPAAWPGRRGSFFIHEIDRLQRARANHAASAQKLSKEEVYIALGNLAINALVAQRAKTKAVA